MKNLRRIWISQVGGMYYNNYGVKAYKFGDKIILQKVSIDDKKIGRELLITREEFNSKYDNGTFKDLEDAFDALCENEEIQNYEESKR